MIPQYPFYHGNGIKIYCRILSLFLLLLIPLSSFSQDLAFPTATGAGAYATGGRGKPVYTVTNLNNSGPGSFRQCLENTKLTDGGIITFAVSGTINLTSQIYFYNQDNITIAGQTAPEGGITIANYRLRFQNVNNLIMRYIRVRPGYAAYPASEIDSFEIFQCSNYIIDHCSFSWGTDESVDSGIGNTYTWQRNIFAESKTGMIMGAEPNTSYDLSFNNNLFYHCSHRFPNWQSDGRVDVINNIVWNWRTRMSVPNGGFEVNHINNYYVHYTSNPAPDTDIRGMLWDPNPVHFPTIYTNGNYVSDVLTDPNADNWFIWRFRWNPSGTIYSGVGNESPLTEDFRTLTPFPQLGQDVTVKPAADALDDVKYDVGSNARLDLLGNKLEDIDFVDNEYLTNVQNGTIIPYTQDNVLETAHHDAFINSVSSTPINVHPTGYDSDNDGMPDAWEMNRFNTLANNGQTDSDNSGYTDVEDYLNGIDADALGSQVSITVETNVICEGAEVVLTASGADSYVWDFNAQSSATITVTPTETTTYTVTGSHSDGSTTQDQITITVNPVPTANAGNDVETCQGTPVTLTATGGTSYEWSNGEQTQSITVNPNTTTTYSVIVTQNACVSESDAVVVTVNEIPTVDAGQDETIFIGESVTLTATGADTYLWSTGETTQSITVNPILDTSYSVTGTTNTCENTDTVTVFLQDDSVAANAGSDTEICNGETTTLTATGGTTYLWSTGATTASINVSPTTTTTYTVTAFSVSGNNAEEDSVIVTVNEIPVANAGSDTEVCFGNATTLSASGGSSYLWSTGETSQTITVNPTETTSYSVEVFENNCSSIDQVSVTVNALPNVSAGSNVTIAEGASTTLTATGADTYLWNTGETTASITVSPNSTTTYSVSGFSNGCESTDEIIVTVETENVTANAGADVSICEGETTTLTASGGSTYLWNTGATSASIDVSPASTSTYTVTVFSASGNTSDNDNVTVTVNQIPNTTAGSDVTITEGESTTLTASGATTYLWSTGETTSSITVSPNGTTTYSVTGFNNGCEATDEATVTVETENVTANAGADVAICEGETTTLTASGGTTYLWNTGETTASIVVTPNATTTYTVTAFNTAQTASDAASVTVTVNQLPNTIAGSDVTITEGESTTLTASGATTYLWSTGETTSSITVSPNGTTTYSVTGFNNGCESTDEVTVTVETENVTANAGADVTICDGETTTLTASGGTTYLWNTGETTASIAVTPNTTTTYTVTAFNTAQTASDAASVTVTVNELPNTSAGSDVTITEGESTTLTATGAQSYLWSTGETTSSISITPNVTTTYTVTGFTNDCEFTDELTVIVEPFEFTASAGADQVICQGYETTLTATEGDSYLWSTGETTQSITVNPANTQTYSVTVYQDGFEADAEVMVSVNPNPNVVIANGNEVMILEGEFVTLSASGANSYVWNNGATQPNIAVSPTTTTTFEVTGYINNCEDTKAVIVNVLETVEAYAGEDLTICSQETVVLTAEGGDEYLWNTGETTQSIEVTPDEDTEYSVLVYNALDSDEATVVVYVEECNIIQTPPESEDFGFIVYQEPTSDVLKVKIDGLQNVTARGISIYDMSGKVLYTEMFSPSELQDQSQMTREINTNPYARGIYMVRLIYDDTSIIKKIPIR